MMKPSASAAAKSLDPSRPAINQYGGSLFARSDWFRWWWVTY
jgi:hypothetical protein